MRGRIGKWGNSLGVRIPKSFAEEVEMAEGSEVDLSISEGRLVVAPAEPVYDLDALLDQVTREVLHGEIPTGEHQGRESW